ncbi:MAG: FAD-binding oxidoreductase [Stellaceae bacterium]
MSIAIAPRTAERSAPIIAALRTRFGERVTTAASVLEQHGRDEGHHATVPPDAVVWAETIEDVVAVVDLCRAHHVPVIAYGTGTSLEGHVAALEGGISLDLSRMNKVLRVSPEDLDCTVEAGVTRRQLNEHLRDTGLFFPIDPGADASLGGMAATRASGTNAVRYGTMRENVLSLKIVTADGRVVRTARRARKSSAGYDLTRLFIGSEGTLGIITEVTLRLYGIPEAVLAAVCPFPSVSAAVDTVVATIQAGVPIGRVELLDPFAMRAVNRHGKLDYPEAPTLFFEFHGTKAGVAEQVAIVEGFAAEQGGTAFRWAESQEERGKLWHARHQAHYALMAMRPGCRAWPTDVCVPISRLAQCIAETEADLKASFLETGMVGHVGDGNFHVDFLIDPEKPEEMAEARRLNDRMVMRALALDGTCTGEHGVGYGKMDFLTAEHGEGVALMRTIKMALDPDNILNPGKVVRV